MPRFWRVLFGPRVTVSPQVINGATSPGQQCWIGRRVMSTSLPSITTSWQGADDTCLGDMVSTCFSRGSFSQASLKPLGGSGSLSMASTWPTSRNFLSASASVATFCPMPSATRRTVPNRLPSTGVSKPVGFSNRTAGPPCRSTRSQISVISRWGLTGVVTRFSSPIFSSWLMKSRRSW